MSSFLLGVLLGATIGSSDPSTPSPQQKSILGTIPLRCLGALENSNDEYKKCRWPSLLDEIYPGCSSSYAACAKPAKEAQVMNENLAWEVKVLQDMGNEVRLKSEHDSKNCGP